ncbi:MAG: hypothetical protein SGJ10_00455 [Bacteroidota bacterium]|nr:hypothetical protein [Bacteroidota bacterium]
MKKLINKALRVKDVAKAKTVGLLMLFIALQVQAVGADGMQIALITVGCLFLIIVGVFVWAKKHHEFGEDA